MGRLSELWQKHEFDVVKKQWKQEGKYVCRHGVFFRVSSLPLRSCPCLSPRAEADWSLAALMPVLNNNLKCIVVDTFDAHQIERLGVLRAEIRRRNW